MSKDLNLINSLSIDYYPKYTTKKIDVYFGNFKYDNNYFTNNKNDNDNNNYISC